MSNEHPTKTPDEASVTDHAVLRYLERVKGIDVEALRKEILTPERVELVKMGCKAIKSNGYTLVVKNYTVITVLNTKDEEHEKELHPTSKQSQSRGKGVDKGAGSLFDYNDADESR